MRKLTLLMIGLSSTALAGESLIIENKKVNPGGDNSNIENVTVNLKQGSIPNIQQDGNIYVIPDEVLEISDNVITAPVVSMFIEGHGSNTARIYGEVSYDPTNCNTNANWSTPSFNQNNNWSFDTTVPIGNTEVNRTFTMSCVNSLVGDTAEVTYVGSTETVIQPGDDVNITSFNVVAQSALNTYRVNYTAQNAASCEGFSSQTNDGYHGNSFNTGTDFVITQSATWSLQCTGTNGSVDTSSNSFPVTLETQVDPSCSSVQTPQSFGYQRQNYVFGAQNGVFTTSSAFPADAGREHTLNVVLNTYATIEFIFQRSANHPDGDISWASLQPALTNDIGLPDFTRMTVTSCPGDMLASSNTIGAFCEADFTNGSGAVRLTHRSGQPRCQLVEGQRYYLNIINTQDPANTDDTCITTRAGGCGYLLRNRNN